MSVQCFTTVTKSAGAELKKHAALSQCGSELLTVAQVGRITIS